MLVATPLVRPWGTRITFISFQDKRALGELGRPL